MPRELCRNFNAGRCNKQHCKFVHAKPENACRQFLRGHRNKGDQCRFSHGDPI
eukprot:gene7336-5384_t